MLDEISCKVEIRACLFTGSSSNIPEVMTLSTLLDHFGVSVSALSGVLAAREKSLDLFGVLVLALVTAVGGGSLRDMLVGEGAAFWLRAPGIFHNVCITAVVAFVLSHRWEPPERSFRSPTRWRFVFSPWREPAKEYRWVSRRRFASRWGS